MSLSTMIRLAGGDFGLADVVKSGDRVRHANTRQWGTVLEVIPQRDGTAELKIERDLPRYKGDFEGIGFWGTYHCDRREPGIEKKP